MMSTKAPQKRLTVVRAARRARTAMSRDAQAAYGEIEQGVNHLGKSIAEIQRGLRQAERKIEADARAQIRSLRKEAGAQLDLLQARQREAARTLKSFSAAAGESWRDIKQSADSVLADARATAASVVERFGRAFGG